MTKLPYNIREIERRLRKFRGIAEYLIYDNMRDKIIILVDDGIATGATIFAPIKWIIKQKPKQIIVAIPVGPRDTIEKLRRRSKRCGCIEYTFRVLGSWTILQKIFTSR